MPDTAATLHDETLRSAASSLSSKPCPAPLPPNEAQRLEALRQYAVLDTANEQAYDDITTIAAAVCRRPIALVSLIDEQRQWFKSRVGIDADQTSRDVAFCAHAILRPDEVFEVPDATLDPRFKNNPLVLDGPRVRSYAGAPLLNPQGLPVGTLCVISGEAGALNEQERDALRSLARQVVAQLELRQTVASLEQDNMKDALTGIYNRRAFDRRLREEWSRHTRNRAPLSLVMIDVDRFKQYNDVFGHPAGDRALIQTARLAHEAVRSTDIAARYGGEEFVLVLPETDREQALQVAEKVRAAIEAGPWEHRPCTASLGVAAAHPRMSDDANGLVARADRALYEAKQAGRNRVACFSDWQ